MNETRMKNNFYINRYFCYLIFRIIIKSIHNTDFYKKNSENLQNKRVLWFFDREKYAYHNYQVVFCHSRGVKDKNQTLVFA